MSAPHLKMESHGLGMGGPWWLSVPSSLGFITINQCLLAPYPIVIWPFFFTNKILFWFEWQYKQPKNDLPWPPREGARAMVLIKEMLEKVVQGDLQENPSTRKHMNGDVSFCLCPFLPSGI